MPLLVDQRKWSVRDKPDLEELYPARRGKSGSNEFANMEPSDTESVFSWPTRYRIYQCDCGLMLSKAVCQTLCIPSPLVPRCASPVHRQKAFHPTELCSPLKRGRALSLPHLFLSIHQALIDAQELPHAVTQRPYYAPQLNYLMNEMSMETSMSSYSVDSLWFVMSFWERVKPNEWLMIIFKDTLPTEWTNQRKWQCKICQNCLMHAAKLACLT